MNEEETLLLMAAALYHYDSGLTHDEDLTFLDTEWLNVFEPVIGYIEKHHGDMYVRNALGRWYRRAVNVPKEV